jgi:hypothetical protein
MALLTILGLVAAFLAARFLARHPGGIGIATLAVVAGVVAGELAMLAAAITLNVADPTIFPPSLVLLKAIGNVWLALVGSFAGLWYGRKVRRVGGAGVT